MLSPGDPWFLRQSSGGAGSTKLRANTRQYGHLELLEFGWLEPGNGSVNVFVFVFYISNGGLFGLGFEVFYVGVK